MADIPQIRLKEFFKLFAPKYVLGTTYTVSLAFFEGLVFPEVKRSNLRRCLILCDKIGFQRATVEAGALRSAGREYMAACTPALHSFHPKVWLMVGDDRAALLVGSGNLTQSGFMDNVELFDVVQLERGGAHKAVAVDAARFLSGLQSLWLGVEPSRLLALESLQEVRRELIALADTMPDDPDPEIRFLSGFDRPLVEQFSDFFLEGTLRVAAPYFAGSTGGIRLLRDELAPERIEVYPAIHRRDELDVSIAELKGIDGVSVHVLKLAQKHAFAHLKLYGFDSAGGQWLFTTSANCTKAALGGENIEAGLLRRVDRSILEEYFAKADDCRLPTAVRTDTRAEAEGWLPFWASSHGDAIELVTSDRAAVPLRDVTAALKVGGESGVRHLQQLFVYGTADRLEWSLFPQITDRTSKPPLLSLRATNAAGQEVRGEALVDHPLLLTSDPTHRSAWRAALALLDSEGLPESSDLASIFHLVQEVFDAADDRGRDDQSRSAVAKSQRHAGIFDKIAVWPPVADRELFGTAAGSGRLHDLQWFQRILAELLNPKRDVEVAGAATTADSMDEEAATETYRERIPPRVSKSIWNQASRSFAAFKQRLWQLVITQDAARKIWPIAVAVFLVTLLTRRKLIEHSRASDVPSATDLVRDCLGLLFVDRIQSPDFRPPASCRYRHSVFPAIAADLHENFQQEPSPDLAQILLLLFAYWHASEQ